MRGKKIKNLREEYGAKQETIAKYLGVKRQTVSMYETDKRDPDIVTLKKLAIFFDVSVDSILEDVKVN